MNLISLSAAKALEADPVIKATNAVVPIQVDYGYYYYYYYSKWNWRYKVSGSECLHL